MGDEGSPGFNKVIQEVFGFQYIDEVVLRRVRNAGEGAAPNRWVFTSTTDTSYYHLTDPQYSTLAMIGTGQKPVLYERVRYDAYGTAHHRWGGDVDGDGDNDVDDKAVITTLTGTKISDTTGYHPDADRNRDGVIDSNDILANVTGYQAALPTGSISAAGYADNVFGYCSYVYVQASGLYSVRARWYSPDLGRWLERDPIGYSEGTNLFEYVGSEPTGSMDPLGLFEIAGHYYTTFIAARCAGMSMTDSMHLAYYSQYPDQVGWLDAKSLWIDDKLTSLTQGFVMGSDPNWEKNRAEQRRWMKEVMELIHSLHGGDPAERQKCLKSLLQDPTLSREERGIVIHALGDAFAHTYSNANGGEVAYDAGKDGHMVDTMKGKCPDCLGNKRSSEQHAAYFVSLCQTLGGNLGACATCSARVSASLNAARSWTDRQMDRQQEDYNISARDYLRHEAKQLGFSANAGWRPEFGGTSNYYRQLSKAEIDSLMKKIKKACCVK